MRCQKLAMKKLFTKEQWQEIELEAKFRTLAIDSETNKVICISDVQQQEDKLEEKNDHSREKDVTRLENFAFNSSAMSLLEKEKSRDKTGLEKEAKKKMSATEDITAPVPDNSFVKTTKAEVVHDSTTQNNSSERGKAQVVNNKLPVIQNTTISPTDKAALDIELEAMGQGAATGVNEALDSAR